jgi:hypothetical protein
MVVATDDGIGGAVVWASADVLAHPNRMSSGNRYFALFAEIAATIGGRGFVIWIGA